MTGRRTRLKCDVKCCSFWYGVRISREAIHFRVGCSGLAVVASSYDNASANEHSADCRVGTRFAHSLCGFEQRRAHETFVILPVSHRASIPRCIGAINGGAHVREPKLHANLPGFSGPGAWLFSKIGVLPGAFTLNAPPS